VISTEDTEGAPAISRLAVAAYGDLFRPLPGFNVSNYGQLGIGYGLSLRGYTDAEHGRDIAYHIDGVPLKRGLLATYAHRADQRLTLRVTRRMVPIMFSAMFVQASDRRSSFGSFNRTTVRMSSRPSRMLAATPGHCWSMRRARLRINVSALSAS
jgi:hypothetical protein